MLGALGAILPEALDSFGGNIAGAVWWQVRSGCLLLARSAAARAAARAAPRPGCREATAAVSVCGAGKSPGQRAFGAPPAGAARADRAAAPRRHSQLPRGRWRLPRAGAPAAAPPPCCYAQPDPH
jgi:hypothetical protein